MGYRTVWLSGTWALALFAAVGCDSWSGRCADSDCLFTDHEWDLVSSLAFDDKVPAPPSDPSNAVIPEHLWATRKEESVASDPVVRLGWLLYHDRRLSGSISNLDVLKGTANTPRTPVCRQVDVSCASCHDPQRYGSDFTSVPRNVSNGAGFYDVNAQQTLNVSRFAGERDGGSPPHIYWNGRSDTLWSQAAQVMESAVSMNGHRLKVFWVIAQHYLGGASSMDTPPDYYGTRYGDTFPAPTLDDIRGVLDTLAAKGVVISDSTVKSDLGPEFEQLSVTEKATVTGVFVNVAKAIAAYEWFLTSDNSRFDRFVAHQGDLSDSEKRGLKLFVGRASCVQCHNTPFFSDGQFHDIDVPQAGDHVPTVAQCRGGACDCVELDAGSCLPAGAYAGLAKLEAAVPDGGVEPTVTASTTEFRRGSCAYDDSVRAGPTCLGGAAFVPDLGGASNDKLDALLIGAWRTPSLRDVAMTGPYMHDGIFETLADVVQHYDQGGSGSGLGQSEIGPLYLSARDRDDLVAFLQTLTGEPGPKPLVAPPDADLGAHPCEDAGAPD